MSKKGRKTKQRNWSEQKSRTPREKGPLPKFSRKLLWYTFWGFLGYCYVGYWIAQISRF